MPIACILVAAGGRLSEARPLTLDAARRLESSLRDEGVDVRRAAGRLAEYVRVGAAFVWAFPSLADACRVAAGGHRDDRVDHAGVEVDVVVARVEEPAFVDLRFTSPGPGEIATEVPGLLPDRRREWARRAVYRLPQYVVARPDDGSELGRMSAREVSARDGAEDLDYFARNRADDHLDSDVLPRLAGRPVTRGKRHHRKRS